MCLSTNPGGTVTKREPILPGPESSDDMVNNTVVTNITDRSKDNGRFDVCSIADPMLMNHSLAMHTWHNYYKECFGEWCKTDWYKIKEKV